MPSCCQKTCCLSYSPPAEETSKLLLYDLYEWSIPGAKVDYDRYVFGVKRIGN